MIQMNLQNENRHTGLENELLVVRGKERISREFGIDVQPRTDMSTLLYLKWISNKDLLYGTWNLPSVMWQPGWEGSLGENGYMGMYG